MRRNLAVAFALLMFLVAVAAPAFAQAPAAPAPSPRVTISGFIDTLASWSRNMSVVDINPARGADKEFYGRNRLRPDITAELGTSKFVLALEIDQTFGQVANTDNNLVFGNGAVAGTAATTNGFQRNGANAGAD